MKSELIHYVNGNTSIHHGEQIYLSYIETAKNLFEKNKSAKFTVERLARQLKNTHKGTEYNCKNLREYREVAIIVLDNAISTGHQSATVQLLGEEWILENTTYFDEEDN